MIESLVHHSVSPAMGEIMEIKYVHTNLIAKDWRKLAQFYIDVFSCKAKLPERKLSGTWLDELTEIDSAQINGVHLSLPGFGDQGPTLEIFQFNENQDNICKKINTEGYAHIAFAVDDVDRVLDKIISHGGSTVGKVVKGEVGGVGKLHVVYAKDPEGNIIEVQKWG